MRLHFLLLLMAILITIVGCNKTMPTTQINSIQFDEDGKEIVNPSYYWQRQLENAVGEKQENLINCLLDVIVTSRGYSKFIAARAIIGFYSAHPEASASDMIVKVFADHCIKFNNFWGNNILDGELLVTGDYPKHFDTPLDIKFCIRTDSDDLILSEDKFFPKPWFIQNVKIFLDNKLVFYESQKLPFTKIKVNLKKNLNHDNIYGKHVWRSEFELVGPGGHVVKLNNVSIFKIITKKEMHELLKDFDENG